MEQQPERRLGDVFAFFNDPTRPSESALFSWPEEGDLLLREPVGDETSVHAYQDWIADDLERLTYFALQYHRITRDLVRAWLASNANPETYIYAIAFL